MTFYTLYTTYRSPYARKVRIALLEKGLAVEEIIIDLANRSADFIAQNPLGTVPTLVTPEGLVLIDSTLALHYLESLPSVASLLPSKPWEAWNWEERADRLCDEQVKVFFENQRSDRRQEIYDRADRTAHLVTTQLSDALSKDEYILGSFSLADVAMGSVLNWMTFRLGKTWENPAIAAWLTRLNERESFKQTVPKL